MKKNIWLEYLRSGTTTVNINVRICVFAPYFCSFGLCCVSLWLPLDFQVHLGFILYYFSPLYINSAVSFFYVLYSFLHVYFFLPATRNCQFIRLLFVLSLVCLHFTSFYCSCIVCLSVLCLFGIWYFLSLHNPYYLCCIDLCFIPKLY